MDRAIMGMVMDSLEKEYGESEADDDIPF